MAIRNIRKVGEAVLRKRSKDVIEMTDKLQELIDDMFDTMYEAYGIGLAAPQVGVLRKIVVIDVGLEKAEPLVFINPEIIEVSGEQVGEEGCLSLPGKAGTVTRPDYVKVRALDRHMQPFEIEGTEMFARAVCHEFDHLDGILYVDKVKGEIHNTSENEEEE